jgi:transcriptional regulator with XRE-family HTH domain
MDEAYRRRLIKQRKAEHRSFGASLRRLRAQRGVRRDAFSGVSAKTIARLERDEIERPQAATLTSIAKTLGVSADDITTW